MHGVQPQGEPLHGEQVHDHEERDQVFHNSDVRQAQRHLLHQQVHCEAQRCEEKQNGT